ncbi:MAG: hypothetical protein HC790_13810 [Acaryochloridaceae cyanobacterium CSU_3_4]|nr:hypothetical protein [Acaryochloridaceae cyanobacterium CSU_3_4]
MILGWLIKYAWFAILGCILAVIFATALGYGTEALQWFFSGSKVWIRLVMLVNCVGMSLILLESLR